MLREHSCLLFTVNLCRCIIPIYRKVVLFRLKDNLMIKSHLNPQTVAKTFQEVRVKFEKIIATYAIIVAKLLPNFLVCEKVTVKRLLWRLLRLLREFHVTIMRPLHFRRMFARYFPNPLQNGHYVFKPFPCYLLFLSGEVRTNYSEWFET